MGSIWVASQLVIYGDQMKLPVPELDYIFLSCWQRGPMEILQTIYPVANTIGCSPYTYKAPLLKISPT